MAFDDLASGFLQSFSTVTRIRAMQHELKAQERMRQYRDGLRSAAQTGDLKGGMELAMGAGDASSAKMFKDAHETKTARDFDRLARENPTEAQRADPSRWAQWKAGEDTRRLTVEGMEARLTRLRQAIGSQNLQNRIAQDRHAWQRGQVKSRQEQATLQRGASQALAMLEGSGGDVQRIVPGLSRFIASNPEMFRKQWSLPKHRTPTGLVAGRDKDGKPVLSVTIRNDKTGTTGPMTVEGGAGKGEDAIAFTPGELTSILRNYAGVKPTKPRVGRFKTTEMDDGRIVTTDTATGKSQIVGNARQGATADQIKALGQHLNTLYKDPPMMAAFDKNREARRRGVQQAGELALNLGYNTAAAQNIMTRVTRALAAESSPFAKAFDAAKSVKEQNKILFRVMDRWGITVRAARARGGRGQAPGGGTGSPKAAAQGVVKELEKIARTPSRGGQRATPAPQEENDDFIYSPETLKKRWGNPVSTGGPQP